MNRLVLLLLALTCSTSWAQTEDAREFSQEQLALFETKIRPVLVENCLTCHSNDDKQKGGLSLTSRAGLRRGGESGPAIVPDKPDASLLLEALRYESYEMPPKGKLSDRIIDDFAKWIAMGAPDPRVESAPAKKAEPAIDVRVLADQPRVIVADEIERCGPAEDGEHGQSQCQADDFCPPTFQFELRPLIAPSRAATRHEEASSA